jgi:hypothetical protein
MLAQVREVCPTTTLRILGEGALPVDVRECNEIDRLAFDLPDPVWTNSPYVHRRFM